MQKDLRDMIGSLQDILSSAKGQSFLHQSQAPIGGGGQAAGAVIRLQLREVAGILGEMEDEAPIEGILGEMAGGRSSN